MFEPPLTLSSGVRRSFALDSFLTVSSKEIPSLSLSLNLASTRCSSTVFSMLALTKSSFNQNFLFGAKWCLARSHKWPSASGARNSTNILFVVDLSNNVVPSSFTTTAFTIASTASHSAHKAFSFCCSPLPLIVFTGSPAFARCEISFSQLTKFSTKTLACVGAIAAKASNKVPYLRRISSIRAEDAEVLALAAALVPPPTSLLSLPPPCAPTDDDAFKNDGDNPSKDVEDDAKLEEFDDEDNSKHADVYRRINASAIE
mmetsp:Transcript_221/g.757  ORF Transcript_221/g.757 Transcript_221/m.757 type:complete len:259 (-) Transcript_221:146-922(-)